MQLKKIFSALILLSFIALLIYSIVKRDPYYHDPALERLNSTNIPTARIEPITTTVKIPALEFISENGEVKSIFNYKAPVILINFWASWCLPCIKELPKLNNLKVKYRDKITIVAISIDSSDFNEVKDFFINMNVKSLNFYMDHNNISYVASGALGVPTTLLLDSDLNIRYRISGFIDWEQQPSQKMIDDLLNDLKQKQ
jgi:thiol-disulfide isomerase/thioredoxin